MIELPFYNQAGEKLDKIQVDGSFFGGEIRRRLLRDVIIMYEANQRRGTASTKRRSEVRGSSRKPWKQKHTGRARVGTIRSPIWRHGGIVFGPHPRDFGYDMPKRMKQQALDSALLSKFQDQETVVLDSPPKMERPRTKDIAQLLRKLEIKGTCLIGIKDQNKTLHYSVRNLPGILLKQTRNFNAYDVLKYKKLLLIKDALDEMITQRQDKYTKKDK